MADLKSMFASRKPTTETQNGPEPAAQTAPGADQQRANPFARGPRPSDDSARPDKLPEPTSREEAPREVAANELDSKPASPRLANIFGGARVVGRQAASPAEPTESGDSDTAGGGGTGPASADAAESDETPASGILGNNLISFAVGASKLSQFDDETPASAPTRELPPDLSDNAKSFVELIDGVYGMIHDVELLSNVIRNIMIELKENPQYIKLIVKDDVRTWVRAMRDNMGLARIKKQEKKSGAGRKTTSRAATDEDILSAFNELGLKDLD